VERDRRAWLRWVETPAIYLHVAEYVDALVGYVDDAVVCEAEEAKFTQRRKRFRHLTDPVERHVQMLQQCQPRHLQRHIYAYIVRTCCIIII